MFGCSCMSREEFAAAAGLPHWIDQRLLNYTKREHVSKLYARNKDIALLYYQEPNKFPEKPVNLPGDNGEFRSTVA